MCLKPFRIRACNKKRMKAKIPSSKRFEAQMTKSAEAYPKRYAEHFLADATKKLEEIGICSSYSFCYTL